MEITRTPQVIDNLDAIRYEIRIDGETVGHLDAHTSGLILMVEISDDHQGEGYARALYTHADADLGLYHVPAWGMTDDGAAFADAMGGDTMDDAQAADILGLDLDIVTGAAFAA